MLVLYYDNGICPIFRECFGESGVTWRSWLRFDRTGTHLPGRVRRLLERLIFYVPKVAEDEMVVVFDSKVNRRYMELLRRRNPQARIVVWCWNEIKPREGLLKIADGLDVWSYSPSDCETYGLKYSDPFYFDSIVRRFEPMRQANATSGVKGFLFMGRPKGRTGQIDVMARAICDAGWECELVYYSDTNDRQAEGRRAEPYENIVRNTLGYQGILDVAASQASGLSLRTMESVFFHKKLMTTNRLVAEYDFYDENNIYIWGESPMTVREFLDLPYRPVPREVADRYLLSAWVRRMEEAYEDDLPARLPTGLRGCGSGRMASECCPTVVASHRDGRRG